jgi:sugar (pentulose or hexulose) kinase
VDLVSTEEAAALGAALAAGVAVGIYGSVAEALNDAAPSRRVRVGPGLRAGYDAAFRTRWLPAVLATVY